MMWALSAYLLAGVAMAELFWYTVGQHERALHSKVMYLVCLLGWPLVLCWMIAYKMASRL